VAGPGDAGVVETGCPDPAVTPLGDGAVDDGESVPESVEVAGSIGAADAAGLTIAADPVHIPVGAVGTKIQSRRAEPLSWMLARVPVPAVTRYRYQIGAAAPAAGRNDVSATVNDPAFVVRTRVPVVTPSDTLPGA
jgi:hypothetical protein